MGDLDKEELKRLLVQRIESDDEYASRAAEALNRPPSWWESLADHLVGGTSYGVKRMLGGDHPSSETQKPAAARISASPPSDHLKVFLCHSSGDSIATKRLYERLRADGLEPWLDEVDLLAGQDWDLEIRRAVRNSHVVVICLSNRSISKAGYVQKEIQFVLDRAAEQPEGTIFVIPLKLEECEIPNRLSRWHWVNLFEDEGYQRLLRSLGTRASQLGLDSKRV